MNVCKERIARHGLSAIRSFASNDRDDDERNHGGGLIRFFTSALTASLMRRIALLIQAPLVKSDWDKGSSFLTEGGAWPPAKPAAGPRLKLSGDYTNTWICCSNSRFIINP